MSGQPNRKWQEQGLTKANQEAQVMSASPATVAGAMAAAAAPCTLSARHLAPSLD